MYVFVYVCVFVFFSAAFPKRNPSMIIFSFFLHLPQSAFLHSFCSGDQQEPVKSWTGHHGAFSEGRFYLIRPRYKFYLHSIFSHPTFPTGTLSWRTYCKTAWEATQRPWCLWTSALRRSASRRPSTRSDSPRGSTSARLGLPQRKSLTWSNIRLKPHSLTEETLISTVKQAKNR